MNRRQKLLFSSLQAGLDVLSRIAPGTAGRVATYLWFTPFPFATVKPTYVPDGAEPVAFDSGESIVSGYSLGSGPRVALLIHGWAGSSRQFRHLAARLANDGYRAVAIDLPAHGASAGRSTDVLQMTAAIEAVGGALGPVDLVVAHSLGAMAASLALQGALEARSLVFVAPGTRPGYALRKFAVDMRLRPSVFRAVEREMEERFGADVWSRIPREVMELRVPDHTLVVHDADDEAIPVEHSVELADRWGAELMTTTGLGHNRVLRDPAFIDRVASVAASAVAPA